MLLVIKILLILLTAQSSARPLLTDQGLGQTKRPFPREVAIITKRDVDKHHGDVPMLYERTGRMSSTMCVLTPIAKKAKTFDEI